MELFLIIVSVYLFIVYSPIVFLALLWIFVLFPAIIWGYLLSTLKKKRTKVDDEVDLDGEVDVEQWRRIIDQNRN